MHTQKIPRSKTAAMQLIVQLVARGYHCYTSGMIPAAKAYRLVQKFVEAYDIGAPPHKRSSNAKHGMASVHLVVYPTEHGDGYFWFLLATADTGPIKDHEHLLDARNKRQRLTWGGYELVWLQRSRERGGGNAWTWRRTKQDMGWWVDHLTREARHPNPAGIQSALEALARSPGFGGMREQTERLYALVRGCARHELTYPSIPWVRMGPIYDRPPRLVQN